MYHMKFEELAMRVHEADLDVEHAMDLLKYVNALKNFGACAGKEEMTLPDLDYSCGSSESGDSSRSANEIMYGTRAKDVIPYEEFKLGHIHPGNANQAVYAINQPGGKTPFMLGRPRQSFGFKDVHNGIDERFYNTHSAQRMVYPGHPVCPDVIIEEALNSTGQVEHDIRSAKSTFFPEYKHANGCSRKVQGLASSTFNAQGTGSVAPVIQSANNIQLPRKHPAPPMPQAQVRAHNMQFPGHYQVPPMLQRCTPASDDLCMPIAGEKDSQKQVLLVCKENLTDIDGMQELAKDFRHEKFFYFRTAVKFTRWLFKQHRGQVSPWSVLVVGWCEGKPCMTALEAAFSGDMSKVRPDARRAVLKKPSGGRAWERRPVSIAVAKMVLLLDAPSQRERAQTWAKHVGGTIPDLEIVIVESLAEISTKFGCTNNGQQQPVDLPVGGMLPHYHADQEMKMHYIRLSV